jgi:FimV-like protein
MAKPTPKPTASIEALKQRIARDPLSRAFLQLAEEYRRSGQFEEAIRVCQEGLARHPAYHTARISLGRTYLESGDLENARKTLADVLELAPENHLAGKLLAEVQRRLGDQTGAVETYRAILRHYPGDREVEALLNDLLQAADVTQRSDPTPDYLPEDVAAPAAIAPAPEHLSRAPEPISTAPESISEPPNPFSMPPEPISMPPDPFSSPPDPPPPVESFMSPLPSMSPPAPAPSPSPQQPAPAARITATPPVDGFAVEEEEEPDALQTNTLAELYLRQGLVDRAIEVYRSMLQVDPGNVRARRRLDEVVLGAAPGAPSEEAAPSDETPSLPEPPLRVVEDLSSPLVDEIDPAASSRHRDRIARLERWLSTIRGPAIGAPGMTER